MSIALLVAALSMGLLGSPHCLGMCGGLVTAFGLAMPEGLATKKHLLITAYHAGRLTSYAVLGAVASLFGAGVLERFLTGHAWPRILLGGGLIFAALLMLGVPMMQQIERVGMRLWQALSPVRARLFPLSSLPRAYGAGLMWGLLPCGLVYGALVLAIGMGAGGHVAVGALFMLVFGLGTLPMLIVTHSAAQMIQHHIRRFSLRQLSGVLMLISGIVVAASPMMMQYMHGHGHHTHQPTADHQGAHQH